MKPIHTDNRIIGLLGGSFNPAHEGHLAISLHALHRLKFDEVWWLVSPQNPLKPRNELADYKERLRSARGMADHPRIMVSDIEARFNLRYSYQTIARLKRKYPRARFVWLMGADNLAQFHRWRRWRKILHTLPVVVFDRVPYSHTSLRSKAALYARRFLLKNMSIGRGGKVPSLAFFHLKRDPHSSTAIRKTLGNSAFLGHNKNRGSK